MTIKSILILLLAFHFGNPASGFRAPVVFGRNGSNQKNYRSAPKPLLLHFPSDILSSEPPSEYWFSLIQQKLVPVASLLTSIATVYSAFVLTSKMNSTDDKIALLMVKTAVVENRFDFLDQNISNIKSDIKANKDDTKKDMNDLKSKMEFLILKAAVIENRFDYIDQNISNVKSDIKSNKDDTKKEMNDLKSDIKSDKDDTKKDMDDLKSCIIVVNNEVSNLTTTVAVLQNSVVNTSSQPEKQMDCLEDEIKTVKIEVDISKNVDDEKERSIHTLSVEMNATLALLLEDVGNNLKYQNKVIEFLKKVLFDTTMK